MAGSLNQATIIGNLGRDPEVRSTQSGDKCANLSIATSETWKDKATGERKEKTEWHRVVIWGQLAEIAERYLQKGSKVLVQGKLQTRKWTDQQGVERYSTEIVLNGFDSKLTMLDRAGGADNRPPAPEEPPPGPRAATRAPGTRDEMDDDIPF